MTVSSVVSSIPAGALPEQPFTPSRASAFRQLFERLQVDSPYAVLLESAGGPEALTRQSILAVCPTEVLTLIGGILLYERLDESGQVSESTQMRCDNAQDFEKFVEKYGHHQRLSSKEHGDQTWFGVLGYEFYRYCLEKTIETQDIEALKRGNCNDARTFPELCLVRFAQGAVWDVQTEQLQVWGPTETVLKSLWERLSLETPLPSTHFDDIHFDAPPSLDPAFTCSFSQADFEAQVSEVLNHIAGGDVYQANLTMQFSAQKEFAPLQVYESLSRQNPSPFCGVFKTPQHVLLCNSPERLVSQDEAGKLQTRPIAGTRGRGKTKTEDEALGASLRSDEKERAEHLMLVDLLRNDIGRVSQPGSVGVDELLTLERYSHVTHLVSNVVGQKKPVVSPWDIVRALFPGGTITGCPKTRCIEILNALEPVNRGWYTGSLGYVNLETGMMDWNILIRSLFLTPLQNKGSDVRKFDLKKSDLTESSLYNVDIHVGAGIVADSVPEFEYKECLRKAQASFSALSQSHA